MCSPSGGCPDKTGEPSAFQLVCQKVPTRKLTCLLVEPVSPCSPKTGCEGQWGKTEKGKIGKRGMHTERIFSSSLETLCCPLVCVKVHPSDVV